MWTALGAGIVDRFASPATRAWAQGLAALAAWSARRRLERQPLATSVGPADSGQTLRIRGVVQASETVSAPVSGHAAVLWRASARQPSGREVSREADGKDFVIETEDGHRVRVAAAEAVRRRGKLRLIAARATSLSDLPLARPYDLTFFEIAVAPGDRVEVLGVASLVADPGAAGPFSRSPPLQPVLEAGRRAPLILRIVDPPA